MQTLMSLQVISESEVERLDIYSECTRNLQTSSQEFLLARDYHTEGR